MSRDQTAWDWWAPPPAKDSDTAITPRWIADWLGYWAELDPCAHPQQLVHAEMMLTEHDDGLRSAWVERFKAWLGRTCPADGVTPDAWAPRVWCNPPYSRPTPWVVESASAVYDGASVVLLLRADLTTRWAALALEVARDRNGWAGLTRARVPHGAVRSGRPDLPAVFEGSGWGGHLMVAAGPDIPEPPRERLWMLDTGPGVVVPALPARFPATAPTDGAPDPPSG